MKSVYSEQKQTAKLARISSEARTLISALSQRSCLSRTGWTWGSCETLDLVAGSTAEVWWRGGRSRHRFTHHGELCWGSSTGSSPELWGQICPHLTPYLWSGPFPGHKTLLWAASSPWTFMATWSLGWLWLHHSACPHHLGVLLPVRTLLLPAWCNLVSCSLRAAQPYCTLVFDPVFFVPCKIVVLK